MKGDYVLMKISKKAKTLIFSTLVVMAMMIPAFAAEPDMNAALATAFTGIKDSVLSTMLTALPIALAIVGSVFGVKYGIRFFKSIAKG